MWAKQFWLEAHLRCEWHWAGHVARMDRQRLAARALSWRDSFCGLSKLSFLYDDARDDLTAVGFGGRMTCDASVNRTLGFVGGMLRCGETIGNHFVQSSCNMRSERMSSKGIDIG